MDEAIEKYEEWERKLWKAEAIYRDIESQTKTILAENYGLKGSVKERENEALISKAHKDHLLALSVAREDFLKCKSARDLYRTRWEHERTREASMRKLQ